MIGLDVVSEGTGELPLPMGGVYLLTLCEFGLDLFKSSYGYWEGTEEGWAGPRDDIDRWWLLRVSS